MDCVSLNDADIVAMMATLRDVKALSIIVDHNKKIEGLRTDVIVSIPGKYTGDGDGAE
jgi:hypothetical protein